MRARRSAAAPAAEAATKNCRVGRRITIVDEGGQAKDDEELMINSEKRLGGK